uniref:G-protein coupled receptors family 3 profile domain-containing protein n=1 Tax=Romanomermis culicivorax TaxID=13658 RepID=A0A915IJ65_ROMCU
MPDGTKKEYICLNSCQATIFVVVIFLKHNKTPVIMASGRELCYVMLAGIFFCYLMTFAVLCQPSKVACGIQRMGLGLCLCIIYAAILTKTSRLSRIFTNNVRALQRPRFISPRAQVIICCVLVSIQILGGIVWLVKNPPNTSPMYALNRLSVTIACEVTPKPMLVSFSYIALLITLCTFYAFKTRKIPENFNETKHIGFTMYATCIIWLSFVPIYFGTNDNFKRVLLIALPTWERQPFSPDQFLTCIFEAFSHVKNGLFNNKKYEIMCLLISDIC